MIPLTLIDTADLPDGGTLRLMHRGADFVILFGRNELMSSRLRGSEEALATLGCAKLGGKAKATVLIGGLGMGFTLRAVLGACAPTARIVVVELVAEVVAWARGPLAHLFGDSLRDPRVTIEVADVHDVIDRAEAAFDAILLDVDNGPDGFMRSENDRLYCNWGLRSAHGALRPGGVLAAWSAYPDAAFGRRLERAGFVVEEARVPAYLGSEAATHVIWFAAKPLALARI